LGKFYLVLACLRAEVVRQFLINIFAIEDIRSQKVRNDHFRILLKLVINSSTAVSKSKFGKKTLLNPRVHNFTPRSLIPNQPDKTSKMLLFASATKNDLYSSTSCNMLRNSLIVAGQN